MTVEKLDCDMIQKLLGLLNPLHGSMDRQVYNQVTDEHELDAPSDREYDITITAKQVHEFTWAVMLLEARLRDYIPPTAA